MDSPPTLVWSLPGHGQAVTTHAFAKRHVAVSLPDRNVLQAFDADVLGAGRGKHLDRHPGNLRLAELINNYKTVYHNGATTARREIVDMIISILFNENCRYLKLVPYQRNANIWYWIQEPESRSKISQKLRDACKTFWAKQHFGLPPGNQHHLAYPITMMPTPSSISPFPRNQREPHFQACASRTVEGVHAEAQTDSGLGSHEMTGTVAARVTPRIATSGCEEQTDAPPAFNLFGSVESLNTNNVSHLVHHGDTPKPAMLGAMFPSSPTGNTCRSFWAPNRPIVGKEPTPDLYNKSTACGPHLTTTPNSLSESRTVPSPKSYGRAAVAPSHLLESVGFLSDVHQGASLLEQQLLRFDNDALFDASQISPGAGSSTAKGDDKRANCCLPEQQHSVAPHNAANPQSGSKPDDPQDFTTDPSASANLFEEASIILYDPHLTTSQSAEDFWKV